MLRRWLAGLLAALALVAVPLAPAVADEVVCDGGFFESGSRELFEVDEEFVPKPFETVEWSCASRFADRPFGEEGSWTIYQLAWPGMAWDGFVRIVRAFEDQGWGTDLVSMIDVGSGETSSDQFLSADELAAMDPPPTLAHARFSHAPTGKHIITLDYTDGIVHQDVAGFGLPTLVATIELDGPLDRGTSVGDPSVFSGLKTIAEAIPTPVQAGVIAGGAVFLMLVVGWPSSLLNSVVGSRYDGLVRWVRARFRPRPATTGAADPPKRGRLPGWLMWPGFAAAAVIGAFVDPDFGVNPMSIRVVITLFLSFVLFNLATWAVVRRVAVRLQPDADPYLRFRWGSLAIVILAVVVARILGLEPGVVFGLVAGIAYATALQASKSAAVVLAGSGFGIALALVAWVGYSLLAPVTAGSTDVVLVFLVEFLSAVTVKGVSSLPLALLPLGNLEGAKLIAWKRWAWAAAYAVGLAAFMLVLLTIPKSWGEIPGDFVRWLVLFGLYALLAIVVWAVNAWWLARKPPKETPVGEQPDAITID